MIDLPDINVWIALVDPVHRHHERARRYWEEESGDRIAFCRITMLGFLRIVCQPKAMAGGALTVSEAWNEYQRLLKRSEIHYFEEPLGVDDYLGQLAQRPQFNGKLWTDAYLAGFAVSAKLRLVSLDGDYHQFPGLDFHHLTVA